MQRRLDHFECWYDLVYSSASSKIRKLRVHFLKLVQLPTSFGSHTWKRLISYVLVKKNSSQPFVYWIHNCNTLPIQDVSNMLLTRWPAERKFVFSKTIEYIMKNLIWERERREKKDITWHVISSPKTRRPINENRRRSGRSIHLICRVCIMRKLKNFNLLRHV